MRLKKLINTAAGREPADLLLTNGRIFNVFTGSWFEDSLAITGGEIVGWGDYHAKETIDCSGKYITAGFCDAHVHVESSSLNPREFVKTVLPCGTTTVICDPHEIANVAGTAGIEYMLDATGDVPINAYFMLPSCVPASPFEAAGHSLEAEDLRPFTNHPRVLGLGEFMNYPGVENCDEKALNKLRLKQNLIIDGHAPLESGKNLNAYLCGGACTEHECTSVAEALEKLSKGMYIAIREGSFCRNLLALLPLINQHTLRRCLFCTDDRSPRHITDSGHINHIVSTAVKHGLTAEAAITIATLNVAECYGLHKHGAIAPGYRADVLVLDDIEKFRPALVIHNGKVVARNGKMVCEISSCNVPDKLAASVNTGAISPALLDVAATGKRVRVIGIVPFQAFTREIFATLPEKNGLLQPDIEQDIAKIAVVERHHASGSAACGFLQGLGIRKGSIAQTIAHDSHNIIAAGVDDAEILFAIEALRDQNGGVVVTANGKVTASLPLPIGGLMSEEDAAAVIRKTGEISEAAYALGVHREFNPFISLAFMSLSVIPELKLTATGLFDARTFQPVGLLCD